MAEAWRGVAASIDALDLPIQLFAVGTAVGMMAALIRHNQTGEVDHWPAHIAVFALIFFGAGLLFTIIEALT
jgi:TRAP-type C4-dicarboxylate transport system permease small subunit